MNVTFWGVRGSIACPGPRHARVGGNTSCVEVTADGVTVVLDAGTGLRPLGASLAARHVRRVHLLLSHTHWDHTCGLPFFSPLYDARAEIDIVAGQGAHYGADARAVLFGQIAPPSFPVSLAEAPAKVTFRTVAAGATFAIERKVRVTTAALAHPGGAVAYRVEHGGVAVAYVTDTEHGAGEPDARVLGLIERADLVIYDSTYTDAEMPSRRGWGHSSWEEGVRLCRIAHARRLAIFHHDPDHDDRFMARVAARARRAWSGAFVAREGMRLRLRPAPLRGAR
ncbi:MAG: MBL fold metallo-hydrolase [Deltaproteobacteria bacterium]|nr:MBL fold metallo-hydrolase [Deltaproteobacteria bacterium]